MRAPFPAAIFTIVLLATTFGVAADGDAAIVLQEIGGGEVTLDDALAGGPKLVVFWTTWCGYCRQEIPRLKQVHERYASRGLEVIAIDPGIRDTLERARAYVQRYQLPYRVLFDPSSATVDRYDLSGTPTLILFDAEGREVHRGNEVDLAAIDALLGAQD